MAENVCEVRTDGGIFRNWTSVAVAQDFRTSSWVRTFRLQTSEVSAKDLRLKPGDRVDITLAGEPVVVGGRITDRQAAYDANRHGIQVDGTSKAAAADHVSADVPGGQFKGYTLSAIANSVLKPVGVKFKIENGPAGADEKFRSVVVRHGETPFALLKRLCRQRGLWMRTEPDGTIVAGWKDGGAGPMFEEGRNILAASCCISAPWIEGIVMRAQQPGTDQKFGRPTSEVSAKGSLANGMLPGAKRIVIAEMPLSEKETQQRADMEIALMQAAFLKVSITYQGWLKPGAGGLWSVSDRLTVKSPMLFPAKTGTQELRLAAVIYNQDANAGTTTTIEAVNDKAFGISGQDATKNDGFYDPASTKAQPEQTST